MARRRPRQRRRHPRRPKHKTKCGGSVGGGARFALLPRARAREGSRYYGQCPFALIVQRSNRFVPRDPSRRLFDRIAGVRRLVRVALVSRAAPRDKEIRNRRARVGGRARPSPPPWRLFDRGGSGDDPVARRRPRQRRRHPQRPKHKTKCGGSVGGGARFAYCLARARVKHTNMVKNALHGGCLIGVAAATTPWLGTIRGSGRRHPQRTKRNAAGQSAAALDSVPIASRARA